MGAAAAARPWWDFPRSLAAVRGLVVTGNEHGIPAAAMLRGTRLTAAALDTNDALVEAGQELTVARNLIANVGDIPGLGVEAGSHYKLSSPGIIGLALLASATMRHAVELSMRFVQLTSAFVRVVLSERGDKPQSPSTTPKLPPTSEVSSPNATSARRFRS